MDGEIQGKVINGRLHILNRDVYTRIPASFDEARAEKIDDSIPKSLPRDYVESLESLGVDISRSGSITGDDVKTYMETPQRFDPARHSAAEQPDVYMDDLIDRKQALEKQQVEYAAQVREQGIGDIETEPFGEGLKKRREIARQSAKEKAREMFGDGQPQQSEFKADITMK